MDPDRLDLLYLLLQFQCIGSSPKPGCLASQCIEYLNFKEVKSGGSTGGTNTFEEGLMLVLSKVALMRASGYLGKEVSLPLCSGWWLIQRLPTGQRQRVLRHKRSALNLPNAAAL